MSSWAQAITIGDLLIRTAERRPDHEALVLTGERYTYREVADRARRAARSLAALGVRRGDHVGLLMPNCPDFVFLFFGVQLLGAVAVPINTRFRVRELSHVIENADLKVLITSDIIEDHVSFVSRLHETFPELAEADGTRPLDLRAAPRLRRVVVLGKARPAGMLPGRAFHEGAEAIDPETVEEWRARVRLRDPALILYTSGTTAHPKGCLLTHEAVVRVWTSVAERLRLNADDRVFDPLPMFHMSCIGPMIFAFEMGATLLTMVHFEAETALDMIVNERATWLYTVFPTVTMGLIDHPGFKQRDLSRVRGLMNVGPPDALRVMQDAFPRAVQIPGHFGMTEMSGAITCEEWDAPLERRLNTTGTPLPGVEVRVVDPSGAPLGPGERGELCVRGYGLMEGYYRDPEHTAAVFDEDGWLHTGDLGSIDADGRVIYQGRLKDMLKVGGENVAATEIESYLSTHPAVKLAQVVGAPDDRLTEVPVAFVEVAAGHRVSESELIEYCRGRLASYKVPRQIRFVTEWPMSATKIQKFRLREQIAAEMAGATGSATRRLGEAG